MRVSSITVEPLVKNHWPSPANTESTLLHHLVGFGRRLRAEGVAVDPASMIVLCRAMDHIDIGAKEDVRAAAKATLVNHRDDLEVFDRIFAEYWKPTVGVAVPTSIRGEKAVCESPKRQRYGEEHPLSHLLLSGDQKEARTDDQEFAETISYSAHDILSRKDLGSLDEEEIRVAQKLIAQLVKSLVNKPGRRYRSERTGSSVDFRRSFRRNLQQGFAGLELTYRKRRIRKLRLMVLCDVSGSMERYSRFLLDFIYALRHELPATEAGVFSTHMTPITAHMEARDLQQSLRQVADHADGWGGGTDIGRSLAEFNAHHARSMLKSKTVMIILSDGWDRGDARVMRKEIVTLRRRVHKLIWLNPLLGSADYQPLCRGIRSALPYLDHFLPAHNLASLAAVSNILRRM